MTFLFAAGLVTVMRGDDPIAPFRVDLQVILRELHPDFCWFHPRAAAIPGRGRAGRPAIVVTLQKHLRVSDHYSGLYFMRSDDGGKIWTDPVLPPELDWRQGPEGETIAVCDATPGWHGPSRKLLVIGTKLRYSKSGEQLLDLPRSHECAYATYDPKTKRWTPWKMLELPETDGKFFLVAPGCVQWLVRSDGTLLIPMYFKGASGSDYSTTVLHCAFDGNRLTHLKHGDELKLAGGRGLCEPSLAHFQGRYFLTLRNDNRGYVTVSDDGLHFDPINPWTFDDGQELGSYNTQQHWLVRRDGTRPRDRAIYLAYTRRGAGNDHIPRNRAPLFLAQVDPDKLRVIRRTEQVLIPERGVMLGNFGASAITPQESWVTDAEFVFGPAPNPRGADGSVYAARVKWMR